jgi:hypothetical protein
MESADRGQYWHPMRMRVPCAIPLFLVLGLVLTACGHATMRGTVVMTVSDTEAHVCMGKGEVRAGDAVECYHHPKTANKRCNCNDWH